LSCRATLLPGVLRDDTNNAYEGGFFLGNFNLSY